MLELGDRILFSKRDATAHFDTLRAPEPLQPIFGRPPLTVRELMTAAGWGLEKIRTLIADNVKDVTVDSRVFPASAVWPMGFSWSSFVGQSCMLRVVQNCGIRQEIILALDDAEPQDQSELCAMATDDVLLFHREAWRALSAVAKLDTAMEQSGVQKNVSKDVNLADTMTGLGCELSNSPPLIGATC